MGSIEVIPARRLPEDYWQSWRRIQQSAPELDSPFFHPELTRLTARVRDDVETAVLLDGGRPAGFFPFQRGPRNLAQAVVGRLSEFHGVIAAPDADWTPDDLVRACGLSAWYFDHLPMTQTKFRPHVWGESASPYMDLSRGFEECRAALRASGGSLSQVERKARKMGREVGPLRFVFHANDGAVLDSLLSWKSEQHRRTGVLQVLEVPWVRDLLRDLAARDGEDFGGPLSALYAGDLLVAAHLGLRGRRVLHVWFPAYDARFEHYSPGLILLIEMAREAAARGIHRIDFGKGPERYKANFKSGDTPIGEGAVDRRRIARSLRRRWYDAKRRIRESRWKSQLEIPLRATRRLRQWTSVR